MTGGTVKKNEEAKGATEKLWESTRKTIHTATFKANQYKRIVQKQIDLSALHKKISSTYTDLGMLVDDLRHTVPTDLLTRDEIQMLLQKLDSLKHTASTLEEEIEAIRAEEESTGDGFEREQLSKQPE